jgi:hypothetical protein
MRIAGVLLAALAIAPAAHARLLPKSGEPVVPPPLPAQRALESPNATPFTLVQTTGGRGAALARASGGVLLGASPPIWRVPTRSARLLVPRLVARGLLLVAAPDRTLASDGHIAAGDPLLPQEWWLPRVGADRVEPPGPGRPLTIVDTGLDVTHPDFARRPDTATLNEQTLAAEGEFHGTAVSSVAAAPANGIGVVGVYPQARLQMWDASPGGQLTEGDEIRGIEAAADRGRGVINLSLGSTERDFLEEEAVFAAFGEGSLVVAAAGNDRETGSPLSFPANLSHVLTVAATDEADRPAVFSSASAGIDLAAPGQDIPAAIPLRFDPSGYEPVDGTSFSAPIVSGAAAWVWTARPGLDNTQLFDLMRFSARDVGPRGFDPDTGYGVLDIPAALTRTAPPTDLQEPNDDIFLVRPHGLFVGGTAPLTRPGRRTALIHARIDESEDPEDVYRVWVPARSRVTVSVHGDADANVELWRARTQTVQETGAQGRRDLIAASGRKGIAVDTVVAANRTVRGAYVYADVFVARGTVSVRYSLSVKTSRLR